ncbi:hypothetical protein ACMFMG_011067 [Clarireedia jacksonii]
MTQLDFLSQHENNDEGTNTSTSPDNYNYNFSAKSCLLPIRIITHNIRYATTSPFQGEEPWSVRCPSVCSQLVFNSILPETFVSLQEVLHSQLLDINDALNDRKVLGGPWSYIGVGRDDGKEAGEYSPIFYRPDVWQLLTWKTVWLSETPEKPSKGWDAGCIRLVTCGVFKHCNTKQKAVVLNTHLDNSGAISRQHSAKIILGIVDEMLKAESPATLLLTGDFNSPPDDQAYQIMTASDSSMQDIGEIVPKEQRHGNQMTFTSFGYVDNTPSRIDFIFSAKRTNVRFGAYAVLSNRFDDGIYLSDHRAVVADLEISP